MNFSLSLTVCHRCDETLKWQDDPIFIKNQRFLSLVCKKEIFSVSKDHQLHSSNKGKYSERKRRESLAGERTGGMMRAIVASEALSCLLPGRATLEGQGQDVGGGQFFNSFLNFAFSVPN